MRFKPAVCLLTILGFWGVGLSATIQVLVRILPQGAETESIRITLSSARTGELLRTASLTDERSFAFVRIRSGSYLIRGESPGFLTEETRIELNSFGSIDQFLVTVTLRRQTDRDESLPEERKTTVSVTTLSIPGEAHDEMEKARKASQKKDSLKASKHLEKAIEIYPELYQAYNNLAVEYSKLGRFEESVQALEKSISLQPDDATTHRNLAELYLAFGRSNEALKLVQRSLELEPRNGKALLLLGKLGIRTGRYETALDFFYQASEIDRANHSHLGIGQCLTLLGRYDEALDEFSTFVRLFPEDPRTSGVKTVIAQLEADLRATSD
jgi:tetratricopeptide (TPR) repeat protein